MKKNLLYSLVAAGVIAVVIGGVVTRRVIQEKAVKTSVQVRPALTVQTIQPENASVTLQLRASGNIAAWQDIAISSQNAGLRLTQLRANVGDQVRKGQVLAVFAADTVDAEVLQAKANLLAAQAQAADAHSNAERARSIAETGALSRQQIHQLETAAKATAAQVQSAKAMLQIQKTRQGYTRVLAPDDGVISSRNATLGAVIPAGTEIFRMVRQGRLEWRAEVAGADLSQVQIGQEANVMTSAGVMVAGRVRSISPTLDPIKRIGIVYVDLLHPPQQVLAGMYANGSLILGHTEGLLVPQSAVVSRDGFNYIFVVSAQSKAQQRQVVLGERLGEKVQVLKGLEAQTPLVRSGVGFLADGDLVRVVSAATSAITSASGTTLPASAQQP